MEEVPESELSEIPNKTYYLPHHFVMKESSTTALRVVFDGSAKTTNGISLNDKIMVGPKLQQDIFNILLRFRLYKFAFTADIAKMFRQTLVYKKDSNLQRIVWRQSPELPIKDYRLTTVTYGTACGPYLSTKHLQQLALDEGDHFPLAKEVVLRDFYVDDVMSGKNTIHEILELQSQLRIMLTKGGFDLRKWTSNCEEVLEALPAELRETQLPLIIESDDSVKALGLRWHPAGDYFFFKVNLDSNVQQISKRRILSDVAKLFDPLGWLSPVIIIGKIIFKKLWIAGVDWDEEIPQGLQQEWIQFRTQLFELENLRLERYFGGCTRSIELHGFSDASELAYGAVVYLRVEDLDGVVHTRLLGSKTRVAPVKPVSIPRLELCGATLLSRLMVKMTNALEVTFNSICAWTDSTVTLAWICGDPNRWKVFVKNRVTEIQDLVPPLHWRHVPTKSNPADLASRGVLPSDLIVNPLWWYGPAWLAQSQELWPNTTKPNYQEAIKEQVPVRSHVLQEIEEHELLLKFSSLSKLQRVTSWCLRFIHNSRTSSADRKLGSITTAELKKATYFWIKFVQAQHFSELVTDISQGKLRKNRLQSLSPFLDPSGLLRVGGRLKNSGCPFEKKHPMLLPPKSTFTRLLVDQEHKRLLHGGARLVLVSLQQQYWIVNGRNMVRHRISKCMRCFREKATPAIQYMSDLPKFRVEPARAFLRTGVDYGGPFNIKTMKGRGGKVIKAYICLFVCCTTKAVHLELVTDLSAETFISSLKRFMSRRGYCSDLYSDNGTNFVGANNELSELFKLLKSQQLKDKLSVFLLPSGTNWHFIPAKAPHFGGLWEAAIKSAKLHLRRILGSALLTYEGFYTTLTEVEACLNSRPLTPLTTNPEDLDVLTPGHFLIGEPMTAIAEPDLTTINVNRLSRFQLLQQLTQHFWKRWSYEYLSTLQQRTKWKTPFENLKPGDMVLVKEDNMPPSMWLMARILETFPGKDGHVRVASIKTSTGIFKRPIAKLCLLPIDNN